MADQHTTIRRLRYAASGAAVATIMFGVAVLESFALGRTGEAPGPNPLDILQTYRANPRMEGAVCLGMNCIVTAGAGNELHLWMRGDLAPASYGQHREAFYQHVRRATQLTLGLLRSTMLHDEPLDFVWLGVLLERVNQPIANISSNPLSCAINSMRVTLLMSSSRLAVRTFVDAKPLIADDSAVLAMIAGSTATAYTVPTGAHPDRASANIARPMSAQTAQMIQPRTTCSDHAVSRNSGALPRGFCTIA